ncbi:Di-/tripeptide transporter [Streptomyces sp. RB5]|uniref:Di-/tripeptide transporter n=1 Tax=Streptomyces smaragdinus TaxID=2585196 RepID=A0A7K0CE92_9ACTN|nr:peptide MFS transporter [Streptomyces smaragdinus]MQY11653.1 Di-/tripeptide transporter [Streptomyces smaragdinus]
MTSSVSTPAHDAAGGARPEEPTFLGRPRWFVALFGTDMWERFSFYGMTAILFLYASEEKSGGGLGLSDAESARLFGLYMAAIFIASVPGGWLGDRVLGPYRSILYGGVLILCGHVSLAVPSNATFALGLLLVAAGTGLIKPNQASMLAAFYRSEQRAERDAGFAIFYMSVQVSALIAPIVVGGLGESVGWHYGFGAAAVGMALGLVQYVRGSVYFGPVGREPERRAQRAQLLRVRRGAVAVVAVLTVGYGADVLAGTFRVEHALGLVGLLSLGLPVYFFRRLLRDPAVGERDRGRVRAYIWFFLAGALFWALFIQAGAVFSQFAKKSTDRTFGDLTVPASWFQSGIPLFVLLAAPLFAWIWVRAGDALPTAAKFAIGMGMMSGAYLLAAIAASFASDGQRVSPLWLIAVFAMMACSELSFAPVGMSATTEIAPPTFVSQMVGLFWLAGALGGGIGGALLSPPADQVPGSGWFLGVGSAALAAGIALALFRRSLTRRLGV